MSDAPITPVSCLALFWPAVYICSFFLSPLSCSRTSITGPVLKDVMGHELQHSGAQADWFHEYELSDGQVLDLSRCRLVHWYFLKGDVWVPYSAEDR